MNSQDSASPGHDHDGQPGQPPLATQVRVFALIAAPEPAHNASYAWMVRPISRFEGARYVVERGSKTTTVAFNDRRAARPSMSSPQPG